MEAEEQTAPGMAGDSHAGPGCPGGVNCAAVLGSATKGPSAKVTAKKLARILAADAAEHRAPTGLFSEALAARAMSWVNTRETSSGDGSDGSSSERECSPSPRDSSRQLEPAISKWRWSEAPDGPRAFAEPPHPYDADVHFSDSDGQSEDAGPGPWSKGQDHGLDWRSKGDWAAPCPPLSRHLSGTSNASSSDDSASSFCFALSPASVLSSDSPGTPLREAAPAPDANRHSIFQRRHTTGMTSQVPSIPISFSAPLLRSCSDSSEVGDHVDIGFSSGSSENSWPVRSSRETPGRLETIPEVDSQEPSPFPSPKPTASEQQEPPRVFMKVASPQGLSSARDLIYDLYPIPETEAVSSSATDSSSCTLSSRDSSFEDLRDSPRGLEESWLAGIHGLGLFDARAVQKGGKSAETEALERGGSGASGSGTGTDAETDAGTVTSTGTGAGVGASTGTGTTTHACAGCGPRAASTLHRTVSLPSTPGAEQAASGGLQRTWSSIPAALPVATYEESWCSEEFSDDVVTPGGAGCWRTRTPLDRSPSLLSSASRNVGERSSQDSLECGDKAWEGARDEAESAGDAEAPDYQRSLSLPLPRAKAQLGTSQTWSIAPSPAAGPTPLQLVHEEAGSSSRARALVEQVADTLDAKPRMYSDDLAEGSGEFVEAADGPGEVSQEGGEFPDPQDADAYVSSLLARVQTAYSEVTVAPQPPSPRKLELGSLISWGSSRRRRRGWRPRVQTLRSQHQSCYLGWGGPLPCILEEEGSECREGEGGVELDIVGYESGLRESTPQDSEFPAPSGGALTTSQLVNEVICSYRTKGIDVGPLQVAPVEQCTLRAARRVQSCGSFDFFPPSEEAEKTEIKLIESMVKAAEQTCLSRGPTASADLDWSEGFAVACCYERSLSLGSKMQEGSGRVRWNRAGAQT